VSTEIDGKNLGLGLTVTEKIVSAHELVDSLGNRGERTVVMCHGTFDLVHPGHLRHLAYAKSKGSILVVSVTADQHVTKANLRPYVPQDLRALNLAALQLVDYVVVDGNPEPLEAISMIRPDFFVKGFEYERGLTDKTAQERVAVEAHGGRLLFSPGDFVLSSSAIIENDPPKIAVEKLMTLMEVEHVTFSDLRQTIAQLGKLKVTVLGDVIVDGLTQASIIGGYRKTPTPSVRVESAEHHLGGAGVVAKHMVAAGAHVRLISVVGDDDYGRFALEDLEKAGVDCSVRVAADRPTTFKNAVVADRYRMLRIDTVDNKSIDGKMLAQMADELASTQSEAVVFSDFRHGIFNTFTIPVFLSAVPKGVFTVGDSQVASRWGNILDFTGCDLITPNEQEVRFALGDQDTVVRPLGSSLYDQARCKILMLKLGSRGMMTFRSSIGDGDRRSFFSLDSLAREAIVDPVGAGDAMLAYATLAQVAGSNDVISSILGSVAAGLECEFDGNIPITPALVLDRVTELERASGLR